MHATTMETLLSDMKKLSSRIEYMQEKFVKMMKTTDDVLAMKSMLSDIRNDVHEMIGMVKQEKALAEKAKKIASRYFDRKGH